MKDGTYNYALKMNVPLGLRSGSITITLMGNEISGRLNMLGKSNDFTNGYYNDGEIEFDGSIRSLLSTLQFHAEGTLDEQHINLKMISKIGAIEANGETEVI